MEQKYGLSPRGGKPVSKVTGSTFHSPDFGNHAGALSSSYEDLTRLDRHQPIIIQNFELLAPSQLKFRRRSLSTANLVLSQASLTRSGGHSTITFDQRSSTTDPGRCDSDIPMWANNSDSKVNNHNILTNSDVHQHLSSPSSSTSSKQRRTEKPKRVTFSAKTTLHPYEPEQQSVIMDARNEVGKTRTSNVKYSSKRDDAKHFLPFQYPCVINKGNNSFTHDKSNTNNNSNNNCYKHNHNSSKIIKSNLKNSNISYDLKTYNGEWIPNDSLASHKTSLSNSVHSRLPQFSSLKQTQVTKKEEVKQSHSNVDDRLSSGQFDDTTGQSDMHFSDHSKIEKMTDGKQESGHRPFINNLGVTDCSEKNKNDIYLNGIGIDSSKSKDSVSMKTNHFDQEINKAFAINSESSENVSSTQDRTPNKKCRDFDDNEENYYYNNVKNNDNECNLTYPDLRSERIDSEVTHDITNKDCRDNDSNSNSTVNTDGHNIGDHDKSIDTDKSQTTTFYDVFSTYDVADNEYMSQNGQNKRQNDNNNGQKSSLDEPFHKSALFDSKSAQTTDTNQSSNISNQKSDLTSSSIPASTPNVIRLKFLADSNNKYDKKLRNLNINQANGRVVSQRGVSPDKGLTVSASQKTPNTTSSLHPNSATTPRYLKTKSTIEAVDLSSLVLNPNERPQSQGDINAQFLMNMYSTSGDRKTTEELKHEDGTASDRDTTQSPVIRPPSRKPTDKRVSFSVEDDANHVYYRDPLSSSSMGRQKERQLFSSSKLGHKQHMSYARPLLRQRSSSAHAMMVTGSRMVGQERMVAAEKFLLKTGNSKTSDRTALNRKLEQLIVSGSVSSRVGLVMERSKTNLN